MCIGRYAVGSVLFFSVVFLKDLVVCSIDVYKTLRSSFRLSSPLPSSCILLSSSPLYFLPEYLCPKDDKNIDRFFFFPSFYFDSASPVLSSHGTYEDIHAQGNVSRKWVIGFCSLKVPSK